MNKTGVSVTFVLDYLRPHEEDSQGFRSTLHHGLFPAKVSQRWPVKGQFIKPLVLPGHSHDTFKSVHLDSTVPPELQL